MDSTNYTFYANGNLLSDGVNTYTYDSANRLISVSDGSTVSSYQYNGLGDRLSQNGVNYTLDLNAGLTQVLDDGTNTYTYGLERISQTNNSTAEYFHGTHWQAYGNSLQVMEILLSQRATIHMEM